MDEIFAKKKNKQVKDKPKPPIPEQKEKKKKVKAKTNYDGFFGTRGSKTDERRYTEDGFPIYTDKELRVNEGGDTEDCPFDCQCCF